MPSCLVVDDSAVIRGLITKALLTDSRLVVSGSAANGKMAVDMAKMTPPDIVVLDIEMPVMDGLTALPELLKVAPHCKVIMASALTQSNAAISIKALTLGAADYIGKPSSKEPDATKHFYGELLRKVRALSGLSDQDTPAIKVSIPLPSAAVKPAPTIVPAAVLNTQGVQALAIASSTGGPQALLQLFGELKDRLKHVPVFITQHMPPNFTTILADHLSKLGRPCFEAKTGMRVKPGETYLAPGDYHMLIDKAPDGGAPVIRLTQDAPENYCRPAADPMLRSLSAIYSSRLAVLVLTGMGQDGMLGCKQVVEYGGSVVAQDQQSCVVYGMPKAVADQNLCKAILPLSKIASYLIEQIDGRR